MRQQHAERPRSVRTLPSGSRRDFRLYFGARTVSVLGSAVTGVVLPIVVYDLTRSPVLTGVFAAINGVVCACFGLHAGVLADRVNRKRMLLYSDAVRAVALISIPVLFLLRGPSVAVVFVVAVVSAIFFATFDAANQGVLRSIVGSDRSGRRPAR